MSKYYRGKRTRNFYRPGQAFSLSRSKIDAFMACARCFYLDRRLGVDSPPGYPFSINSAVDSQLKTLMDRHRAEGTEPMIVRATNSVKGKLLPAPHEQLETWRANFKGVTRTIQHNGAPITVSGAIDDLWIDLDTARYVIVDYKATGRSEPVTALDEGDPTHYHRGYERQMDIYHWLLSAHIGVSDTGYFLYVTAPFNGDFANGMGTLAFHQALIPYTINPSWVEDTVRAALECLDSDTIPAPGEDCDQCLYRRIAAEVEVAA